MPEISVIVPVYKVEKYLSCCVESILNQTFEDFELILVDDGSPDNCGSICDQYAAMDCRVRVIHQQNQGLSCARNTGIDNAQGRFLCFVDSDDWVAPEYCRVLYDLLTESTADFSVCGVCRFLDGEEPTPIESEDVVRVSNPEFLKLQLQRQSEFGVWTKLFRRDLFEKIRFMPGKLNEDVIFSADLMKNCTKGVLLSRRELLYYRQRSGSIVSGQSKKGSCDRIVAGAYLLNAVLENCPELAEMTLRYAIAYPWSFVDPIYVKGTFRQNKEFLDEIQIFLKSNLHLFQNKEVFSTVITKRMSLFAMSKLLYGLNAYGRLARVYFYRLIGKDAYSDEHGI